MPSRIKAFGYVRVSVDDEDGNNASIESQIAIIKAHCLRLDIDLTEIFSEPNVSGRKLVRRQFDRMIALATAPDRPVGQVIAYALSRFSRRMSTQEASFDRLEAAGVDFVSITEAFPNNPTGKMMRGVVGLMNEKYALDAAQFTRRDRRRNAEKGFFNGGNVTFGYESRTAQTDGDKERKKLFVVDDEAAVVRLIYSLAENGDGRGPMGTRAIAEWLHARGYTLRGAPFFHGSIDRILTREQYLGRYQDKTKGEDGKPLAPGEAIVVSCPAIIEPAQAVRVAALRARRAPAVTAPRIVNGPTLLTGLIRCGMPDCSRGMTIATGKGGRYRYYKCAAKVNGGAARCECPTLREDRLDGIVLDAMEERILAPARLKDLLSSVLEISDTAEARRRTDLTQATKAKTRAETALGRLLELIETGQMSWKDPVFASRLADRRSEVARLDNTIRSLERQVARGAKRITPEIVERFGRLISDKLRGSDPILQKAYVHLLVDRVVVGPETIRISGSKAALESAIFHPQTEHGRVPSFDREWCRLGDSNT